MGRNFKNKIQEFFLELKLLERKHGVIRSNL
jgi:hypothetical protein